MRHLVVYVLEERHGRPATFFLVERTSITCSTYSAYSTLLDKTLVGEGTMLDGGFVWVAFMEL